MGFGSFLGNLITGGGIARAKEQNKANQAGYEARKKQFGQLQERRGVKLGAVQKFLQSVQPTLQAGAPNYQFDPEILAALQTPVDYAEAAPADVSKGAGYGAARAGIGMGLSALGKAYTGGLLGSGSGGTAGAGGDLGVDLSPGGIEWDPTTGSWR